MVLMSTARRKCGSPAPIRIKPRRPGDVGTNLAIKPGTGTAYVVVDGKAGGFVYTFKALANGFAGSNGGSM